MSDGLLIFYSGIPNFLSIQEKNNTFASYKQFQFHSIVVYV